MKKIFGIIAALCCATIIYAQDEGNEYTNNEFKTIFGGKNIGGYGAVGVGYTTIDDKDAIVFNARGGAVLGHWLAMGLTGTGFMNEYSHNNKLNEKVSMVGGYGGFFVEPIIMPFSGVHVTFPITAGIGGISYTTFEDDEDEWDQENNNEAGQSFFVIEPGIEIEFNIFKFMRMSVFGTYRYVTELDWEYTSSTAMNSVSAGLIFKFGKF